MLSLALILVGAVCFVRGARAAAYPRDLFAAAQDSTRAGTAITHIDSLLATPLALEVRAWLTTARFYALATLHASAGAIADGADSAIAANRASAYGLPELYRRATDELLRQNQLLDRARGYAEAGLVQAEQDPQLAELRGMFLEYRARLQIAKGTRDSGLSTVRQALVVTREDHFPDRHSLLWLLAWLCAAAGRNEDALQAHLQVVGAAFEPDTSHAAELRGLWASRHGSLAGLEEALADERAASRRRMTFEAPRVDRELPAFVLPTLEGPRRSAASLRGHVAVIDFWGTWCGPCVTSLPKLQNLWERYGPRGVKFLAVDVEFEPKDIEAQRRRAREFMTKNHYTFPVSLDLNGKQTEPLNVPAFPTTWVVDREGRVCYQNAGTFEGSEQILAAQIEFLLGLPKTKARGRS